MFCEQAGSDIVSPFPSGVRLGAAQRWLAGRPPLRDEPGAPGRRHRDVLGRHDRLLLLCQEELAQQQVDRLIYDTKRNCPCEHVRMTSANLRFFPLFPLL